METGIPGRKPAKTTAVSRHNLRLNKKGPGAGLPGL
jgi:hypothetical protein